MSVVLGTIAAVIGPLLVATGITLWDLHWTGSAIMLNTLKGSVAGPFFVIAAAVLWVTQDHVGKDLFSAMMLILGGVLGIAVGDTLCLKSLEFIGARRVILIDSIKPAISAVIAVPLFDEPLLPWGTVGMIVSIVSVVVVSLENDKLNQAEHNHAAAIDRNLEVVLQGKDDSSFDDETSIVSEHRKDGFPETVMVLKAENNGFGYLLAALNVVFDVLGAILTKRYGQGFNAFEIAGIRHGSSAVLLLGLVFGHRLAGDHASWSSFPRLPPKSLRFVFLGILTTTFLTGMLNSFAIFQLPLATYSLLISLTPIWAIPVVYVLKEEHSSLLAIVGSVFAVLGVVPLYFDI